MIINYQLMTKTDCNEVAQLLQANSQSQHGGLLGEFPLPKVEAMFTHSLSVVVARLDNKIIGVLFSFSLMSSALPPIAHLIMTEYPSVINHNWFYGPVCIDKKFRGQNILEPLYQYICTRNTGKAVAFINTDNLRSIQAHHKLGMIEIAKFNYNDTEYLLVQSH
ncbi:N-acetyltransferase [Providencia sp.]|uniref:N-acetyltransferase n=1 Tax=Providencia sp. TaxID=589 RepID=UPI000E84A278|nr:N-acetyltransferase [Providencia sp.]MBP6080574.1 N-acetyltransferase [Providencia sp.]HBO22824.1 N-acetyltransferase [Providencia sp.]